MSDDQNPLNPEAAAAIAKVRRIMIIIMTATFLAIGLVLLVIGYRLYHAAEESAPSFADVTQALPPGAKVLSTAVGADHIVVTIEISGVVELRTFDPDTLKPLGRLRLETKAP